MFQGGVPRPYQPPNLHLPNPFSIDIHVLDKHMMQQNILFHFGFATMSAMMQSNVPWVYPMVVYGREWRCTIFILHSMDLNQPILEGIELEREPISLRGIRFEHRPKASAKVRSHSS